MTTSSQFDYTFADTADYSLPKAQRTDLAGRCYECYRPSPDLVQAVQLAIALKRPLLLEGEPGCGKTRLASALVYQLTQNNLRQNPESQDWWPFYLWTVKSYTRARDGLYTFDGVGRLRDAQMANLLLQQETDSVQRTKLQTKLQNPGNYCRLGPLGNALKETKKRAVLLIDEVDKADSDFANDLLLELDEFRFEIPETGETIAAPPEPPIIILTSNREKPLPDAFLRRCLYFNIEFPDGDALRTIARDRLTNLRDSEQALLDDAIAVFLQMREDMKVPGSRPPGTSEFLELVTALRLENEDVQTGLDQLPQRLPLLGILLKTKTDQDLYIKRSQARPAATRKAE